MKLHKAAIPAMLRLHPSTSTTIDLKKKIINTVNVEEKSQNGSATYTHTHSLSIKLTLAVVPAGKVGSGSQATIQTIYISQQSELA